MIKKTLIFLKFTIALLVAIGFSGRVYSQHSGLASIKTSIASGEHVKARAALEKLKGKAFSKPDKALYNYLLAQRSYQQRQ